MSSSSYDGTIDWNEVYRQFYDIPAMTDRINAYLSDNSRVLYAGFGEIAERLSLNHDVRFVEYSPAMANAAQREFANLSKITCSNVLDEIASSEEAVILVVCRISAYWHNAENIKSLISAIQESAKDILIVDFFDSERLHSTKTLGDVTFSDIHHKAPQQNESEPHKHVEGSISDFTVTTAMVSGRYKGIGIDHEFSETRAFYNGTDMLAYVRSELKNYSVSIDEPIVDDDPGFTLCARRVR